MGKADNNKKGAGSIGSFFGANKEAPHRACVVGKVQGPGRLHPLFLTTPPYHNDLTAVPLLYLTVFIYLFAMRGCCIDASASVRFCVCVCRVVVVVVDVIFEKSACTCQG